MKYNIKDAQNEIKNMVKYYLSKDENGVYKVKSADQLPMLILGPAGVGKTRVVEQIAREADLGFVSYSLTHHTRVSLMGLPLVKEIALGQQQISETEYTLSEVIGAVYKQIEEGHPEGILFLDEANCCSEMIQPMLLSFLQTKVLGNSRLPDGWVIVLCGNPPKSIYNKNAKVWDAALMDRLRVIELQLDHGEFLQYAEDAKLHPAIMMYLTSNPMDAYICEQVENNRMELVTYRTWENLSDALTAYEKMEMSVTPLLINQYIKVDRVVKEFYEVYHICDGEYIDMIWDFLKGKREQGMEENLRTLPDASLMSIGKLYFGQLSYRAAELYQAHTALQFVQREAQKPKFSMSRMMIQNMPENLYIALEKIRKTGSGSEKEECLEFCREQMKLLNAEKRKLVSDVERMLVCMDQWDLPLIMKICLNDISKKNHWICVVRCGESETIHRFMKKYEMEVSA